MDIDIHDITPSLLKPTAERMIDDACVRASNSLRIVLDEGVGAENAVVQSAIIDDVVRSALIAEMQRVDVLAILAHLKEAGHPWVPDAFGVNLELDYVWARRASCYLTPRIRNRGDMSEDGVVRLSPASRFLLKANGG